MKEDYEKKMREDKWTGEKLQDQNGGQGRQHRRMRGLAKACGQEVQWLWWRQRQQQHSRQTPSLPLMLPPRGRQPAEAVKVIYWFSRLVRFALDILGKNLIYISSWLNFTNCVIFSSCHSINLWTCLSHYSLILTLLHDYLWYITFISYLSILILL